jgi:alpha-beta hydrolase superfamily lysophospholipase
MSTIPRQKAPRRSAGRWLTAFLGVIGVLVTGSPAVAAEHSPGTVLSATPASLPTELRPWATAKRIEYVSTDVRGETISVTGLVLTPKTNKKSRTVAWGHGTTGLADQCAPSNHQDVFWPEARAAVAELLKRGWTVAATDYPGLGTPAAHPYLVGGSAGRALIDSVKAARNLDHSLSAQYAIDGHSQGGQGALFAGELAPSYDGSLVLRGVAAIAPVSNVDLLAPSIPGTPNQGYLVMALYGLAAVDSNFGPPTVLAPQAQHLTPVLQSDCLLKILDAYSSLTATELVVDGALPEPVVNKLAHFDNPAQSAPSAPILIVQGTADEAVPYEITAGPLLDELNAYHRPVQFVPIEGATHDGAVFSSVTLVANWIAARFSS